MNMETVKLTFHHFKFGLNLGVSKSPLGDFTACGALNLRICFRTTLVICLATFYKVNLSFEIDISGQYRVGTCDI